MIENYTPKEMSSSSLTHVTSIGHWSAIGVTPCIEGNLAEYVNLQNEGYYSMTIVDLSSTAMDTMFCGATPEDPSQTVNNGVSHLVHPKDYEDRNGSGAADQSHQLMTMRILLKEGL